MSIFLPLRDPQARRVRKLSISADILLDVFRALDGQRIYTCTTPIPPDAHVVGITVDQSFNTVDLYVESEEFSPVGEGGVTPPWSLAVRLFTPGPDLARQIREEQQAIWPA